MASHDEIKLILEQALGNEKIAEKLCAETIALSRGKTFLSVMEKMKEDEKRHQEIVQELLDILK